MILLSSPHPTLSRWRGLFPQLMDAIHVMKASELQLAKNPDLIASVVAIKRAAQLARQTAIQTNTAIVVIKDGVLCRISAEELKQQEHA